MSIFATGNPLDKLTKVVPVFMAINNAYAPYAAAAMHSLTQKCDKNRYYKVIILHDGLSWVNRIRLRSLVTRNVAIQFRKISHSLYLKAVIKYCAREKGAGDFFSSAVYYYRFFIPRLFPMYEKGVYIDSDTVLLGDIGELFDIELSEDEVLAAMVDPKVTVIQEFRDYVDNAVGVPHDEYVNSGVMLMDFRKMRKMHYLSEMVDLIEKYNADLVAPDQDYLNVILRGRIKHLDSCWNTEPSENLPKGTKLVHFNLFNKPWHYTDVPCENLFWNAARGTGFYGDLKRQQAAFDEKKQDEDHKKVEALIKKAARLSKLKKPIFDK
ncbi:glycosyltransferase family 8 protein [Candidatus Saccharibacteria bacterium]|nr:glycosyltransferase family 8 protein [Candidatus Saccharibacteria bacterium]MBQ1540347.1 glycosyltransferase family 8 protein [Candidatus Saccharibacteria bacterium]